MKTLRQNPAGMSEKQQGPRYLSRRTGEMASDFLGKELRMRFVDQSVLRVKQKPHEFEQKNYIIYLKV